MIVERLTLGVDDRRHGQHPVLSVVDDGIRRRVPNDGQVFCQVTVGLWGVRADCGDENPIRTS